jgi:curli biogenesis system outer membrane secretion channel CsgG
MLIFFTSSGFCQSEPNLPVIGVTEIKAPVNDPHLYSRVNTKAGNFQVMLETQLTQIGRFKIIERNRVDEILSEQGLNNEFGDAATAGGGFYVDGVDYLVYGSITKFGQTRKDVSTGSFSSVKVITEFDADIKVVDASTGEVRVAETASAVMETAEGLSTGKFQTASGTADPLAEVQRLAAKKVAAIIATGIFPIEVVKGGDTIYVNYGSAILDVGDVLKAFRPGEELIDEATGINLGSEEEEIGTVKVFEVTDKFSKAKLDSGTSPVKGDLLRVLSKSSEASSAGTPGQKRGRKI